jgi:Family of unknown function (DUF6492)
MRNMNPEQIALVTPSFSRDFELCRTLNRSVLEFFPDWVKHYIVVDRRDLQLFAAIADRRTVVLDIEEILPGGIRKVPGLNRWLSPGTVLPISGWLVQQIAKIASAFALPEPTLLMVDSDVVFVRKVDLGLFTRDGAVRLYTQRGGIAPGMMHVTWHQNACRLLGLPLENAPMDDYIGNMISWKTDLVTKMCERVERVTGIPWYEAIARARQFSEYLLYGLYVERIADAGRDVWIDENPRCNCHWLLSPLSRDEVPKFMSSFKDDHLALMISSQSGTTLAARALAISLATGARPSLAPN